MDDLQAGARDSLGEGWKEPFRCLELIPLNGFLFLAARARSRVAEGGLSRVFILLRYRGTCIPLYYRDRAIQQYKFRRTGCPRSLFWDLGDYLSTQSRYESLPGYKRQISSSRS